MVELYEEKVHGKELVMGSSGCSGLWRLGLRDDSEIGEECRNCRWQGEAE